MGKSCQTTQDEAGLTVIFLFYVQPWYKKQIQKKMKPGPVFVVIVAPY